MLLATACLAPAAAAQTESQVTLERKSTPIVVTLKAQYADGARFIGNNPNCAEGIRQTLLYGPDPGYVDTRVGDDTELRSNVAIVRSPEAGGSGAAPAGPGSGGGSTGPQSGASGTGTAGTGASGSDSAGTGTAGGGSAGSGSAGSDSPLSASPPAGASSSSANPASSSSATASPTAASPTAASPAAASPSSAPPATANPAEQQTLELFDGTITISRPGCIDTQDRVTTPSVTLIQGRTTVKGTRFFLDQGEDAGSMDGPIVLDRAAKGDSPALKATADSMTFDTQTRHTVLDGNVRVTSADRTTTASTLELDEKAGVAVLTGSPARSVKGQDVLQGNTLRYYLNSNDVVVLGNVQGDIQINSP